MTARRTFRLESLESRTTPSLTPTGPEFRVNELTDEMQRFAEVAVDAHGNYSVAYEGYDETVFPGGSGVYVRRYRPDGTSLGPDIAVAGNSWSSLVSIAASPNGDFVVAWNTNYNVFAVCYDVLGQPKGPTVQINEFSSGYCANPDVSIDSAGNFVVAWQNLTTGSDATIFARRFDSAGIPVTGDIIVSNDSGNLRDNPSVVLFSNGSFAVAWHSVSSFISSPNGYPVTTITGIHACYGLVSQADEVSQSYHLAWSGFSSFPDLALLPGDCAVAVWSQGGVVASIMGEFGYPQGIPRTLAVSAVGVSRPSVMANSAGHSVVAWGTDFNVFARSYRTNLNPTSAITQTNTNTADIPLINTWRRNPSMGIGPDGDSIVTWESNDQDGSYWGVYARRFVGDLPKVVSATVNSGTASRSVVTSAKLPFNRQLALPTNAATAFTLTGPNGTIPVSVDTSASTSAGANLKLTFPTYPNGLPNGRYTLRGLASQIHDMAGQALDGNGDGVPGDDYVLSFHRLAGDFNGDGAVAVRDFTLFRLAFGSNDLTFDIDGDGAVNGSDFVYFRLVFGTAI